MIRYECVLAYYPLVFTIGIEDDNEAEADEIITVQLVSATGGSIIEQHTPDEGL